jgi:uncharacterized membrane protein YdbT with pleckstrin-like domain
MPPYPRKLINEGEVVVLDLKPHWWFFVRDAVATTIVIVLLALFIGVSDLFKWVFVLALIVWAGLVTLDYLRWTYTHFVLTDRRVISRSGIISKKGTEIPLDRVNNIDFHQRLIDRLVGAGDLDIESAGKDGQSHFDFVRHPDMVQQEIYRQMEVNARRQASWHREDGGVPPAGAAPATAPDIADQIEKLASLRDQGHITPAEYEAKKAELLDRM